MSNTLTCKDCPFCYKDEDDRYPCCHFFALSPWDIAPCEIEDDDPQDDPAIWDD